jgi:hypothetical protein
VNSKKGVPLEPRQPAEVAQLLDGPEPGPLVDLWLGTISWLSEIDEVLRSAATVHAKIQNTIACPL